MQDEFSYLLNQRCSLELYPEENAWHYITVQPTVSNKIIEFSISVVITGKQRLLTSLYNTSFGMDLPRCFDMVKVTLYTYS